MNEPQPFEEDRHEPAPNGHDFRLDLDGYEGPIDVLLQLARDQKVDLTRISILELAEQYLGLRAGRQAPAPGARGRLSRDGGLAGLPQVALAVAGRGWRRRAERGRDGGRPALSVAAPGGHAGGGTSPHGAAPTGPGVLRPRCARADPDRHPHHLRCDAVRPAAGLCASVGEGRGERSAHPADGASIPSTTPFTACADSWAMCRAGASFRAFCRRSWRAPCFGARHSPPPLRPAWSCAGKARCGSDRTAHSGQSISPARRKRHDRAIRLPARIPARPAARPFASGRGAAVRVRRPGHAGCAGAPSSRGHRPRGPVGPAAVGL